MSLTVLVRGSGDVGSAVAVVLHRAGIGVAIHEVAAPAAPRRGMAFADAVFDGEASLDGVVARRVDGVGSLAEAVASGGVVAVTTAALDDVLDALAPDVLVDARMRKRAVPERQRHLAPLTIGLGPNVVAGETTHLAIETQWGEQLGQVLEAGGTRALGGEPRSFDGHARDRFVYAPAAGVLRTAARIAQRVAAGEVVATIGDEPLVAPLDGILRGLTHDGVTVAAGTKVVEVDPRGDVSKVMGLGARPLRIGEGVLRAIEAARPTRHHDLPARQAGVLAPQSPRRLVCRAVTNAPAPRRSCMSVPGSSSKMLAKAPTRGADEIVIDLEDAVATSAKDAARDTVVAALAEPGWRGVNCSVRVNAPRTPWCHADIVALASLEHGPASLVVPKVESAGDLAFVERLLDGVEAARAGGQGSPMRVQALIETAAGVSNVQEIAAASPRLDALILGYADLSASIGRAAGAGAPLDSWLAIQDQILLAARANNLAAIDGPYLGIAVDDGFTAAAVRARDMGFDGKWAIHPAQVAALNAFFTPTEAEIDHARAVIDALAEAERAGGAGAVALDGQMLDEAVRVAALRVLARAGADAP